MTAMPTRIPDAWAALRLLGICISFCSGITACSSDYDVIGVREQSCDEVRDLPPGSLCNFDPICIYVDDLPSYASPCCVAYVSCGDGWLSFFEECPEQCRTCSEDSQCLAPHEVCANGVCVPCPDRLYTTCPSTVRNGCTVFDCS